MALAREEKKPNFPDGKFSDVKISLSGDKARQRPYIPSRIQLVLQDRKNGKLLEDKEIQRLEQELARETTPARFSKKKTNTPYGIIKGNQDLYAIYNEDQKQVEVGNGKYSTVKIAQNLRTGECFALKTVKLDRIGKRYVGKEHQILTQLDKTNEPLILRNSKYGNEKANLIIRYGKGISLHEWLKHNNPSERQLLKIVQGILRAYKELVDKRILHRDLKLENIQYDPETGEVTIVDFGFAIECPQDTIDQKVSLGTPGYKAPEICKNPKNSKNLCHYSQASDMFALGRVIQRILFNYIHVRNKNDGPVEFELRKDRKPTLFNDKQPIVQFIERMYHNDSKERPTFNEVNQFFGPSSIDRILDLKNQTLNELKKYCATKTTENKSCCSRLFSCFTNGKVKESASKKMLKAFNGEKVAEGFTDAEIEALREKNSRLAAILATYEKMYALPKVFGDAEKNYLSRLHQRAEEISLFKTVRRSIV